MTGHSPVDRGRNTHEDAERRAASLPDGGGVAENREACVEHFGLGRLQFGCVLEDEHVAQCRAPTEVGEAVEERVPVVTEPGREPERRGDAGQELGLVRTAREIDARAVEADGAGQRADRSGRVIGERRNMHGPGAT